MKSIDNKALFLWTFVLCMAMGLHCVSSLTGGTEDVNTKTVTGKIYTTNGLPASLTQVQLIPAGYDPIHDTALAAIIFDTTGIHGEYLFKVADSGTYNIYAIDPVNGTCLLKTGVHIIDKTTNVDSDSLQPPSSIKILLSGSLDTMHGYVFFPGTIFAQQLSGKSGPVDIDSVPCGIVPPINYKLNSTAAPMVLSDSIVVPPGGSVATVLIGWKLSKIILLNTTSSGAGISEKVIDFPILVRLNQGNFNFSEALPDGADLRFYKPDNTALPYEIERWDAPSQTAEIWVKIDTIYGNNADQFLIMYWGASTGPATLSLSNSAAVFDTTNGFQGVWHMGQPAAAVASDATANRFNGVPSSPSPTQTPGVIGICQEFNGTSNFIQMPGTATGKLNFPEQGTYTIAAWVNLDTLDATIAKIVEKHDLQYKLQKSQFNKWEFTEFDESIKGYSMTTSDASAKTWVYLAGVRSGGLQYLYVNGVCVTSTSNIQVSSYSKDTGHDITIGRAAATDFSPLYFFKGKIDETRIDNRDRSADWIKLCFMNQNVVDKLVLFK